jgi:ATP adenylyltransferase/5',5'''-P-1,P-4-tetraphosphate phosphorylase II
MASSGTGAGVMLGGGLVSTETVERAAMGAESKDALIDSLRQLDATLDGFRDQLQAIRVALTMRGVIPRGGISVVDAVLSLPQAQSIVSERAHQVAQQIVSELLKSAADEKARQQKDKKLADAMTDKHWSVVKAPYSNDRF